MSNNKKLSKASTVIRDRALLKTMLPENLYLNEEQLAELLQLEAAFESKINSEHLVEDFNILETHNAGIHYFCIQNDFVLDQIGKNKFLSREVIILLFEALELKDNLPSINFGYRRLLTNPTVFKDLELFQKFFWKYRKDFDNNLIPVLAPLIPHLPINVFMFVVQNLVVKGPGFSAIVYHFEASLREPEILKWVSENAPDLKGLPSKWIMKMYALEEFENDEAEEEYHD